MRATQKRAAVLAVVLCAVLMGLLAGTTRAKAAATQKETKIEKAHGLYYWGVIRKTAKLTGGQGRTVTAKAGARVKVVSRKGKIYTVRYKDRTYTVSGARVALTSMITRSGAYSRASATRFVNTRGYTSSTKYLIWVSLYTQHVYVFKGRKGAWKVVRDFACSTGKMGTQSHYGKTKISRKQPTWYWHGVPCASYASVIAGGAFHSWSTGGLGRPASHGCIRCYASDALYLYRTVPVNTAVYLI